MPGAILILVKILVRNGIWILGSGWILAVGSRAVFEKAAGSGAIASFRDKTIVGIILFAIGLAINVITG